MSDLTVNPVDVTRLKVEPGEMLLVKVNTIISQDTAKHIKDVFRKAFEETGGNVPGILVIDDQITVSVVRADTDYSDNTTR